MYTSSRAAQLAYDAICNAILEGRYPLGSHLRETSLAEEIGVSRTPIREALRRLGADGYVTHRPHQGTFVAEWSEKAFSDVADMRGSLGRAAGELVARNATADDLATLRAIVGEMDRAAAERSAKAAKVLARNTIAFVAHIFAVSGNDWFLQTIRQTTNLPAIQRRYHFIDPIAWRRIDMYHHEIILALEARDGVWAGSVLEAYFHATKHMVLDAYARIRDEGTEHSPGKKSGKYLSQT